MQIYALLERALLAFISFILSPEELRLPLLDDSFEGRSDVCFIKRPNIQEIFNILFANCRHYDRMARNPRSPLRFLFVLALLYKKCMLVKYY